MIQNYNIDIKGDDGKRRTQMGKLIGSIKSGIHSRIYEGASTDRIYLRSVFDTIYLASARQ